MTSPLHGIRVLDLSRILAGPWCSQTLSDLGAEVIKIERPQHGDDTRHWGPPYAAHTDTGETTAEAAYFLGTNRGKASVTIDMTTPDGQALIAKLADRADVVIENFKSGHLARYNLDAASLRARNPKLIYCSITGFGQTGPNRDQPGYDFLIQGMAGLMSVTGRRDDEAGSGPVKAGIPVADIMTGMYATIAILASLHRRTQTGAGDVIDMALFDCQLAVLAHQGMNHLVSGRVPRPLGNGHPNIVPYDAFETRDGLITIAVGNDRQFDILCALLDAPDWAQDPRFCGNPQRVTHRHALTALVAEKLKAQPTAHWLAVFKANDIPAGPINTVAEAFAEEQVTARNLLHRLPHPTAGSVPSVRSPIRFQDAPLKAPMAPPTLGQHTDDILRQILNLNETDIAKLRNTGVI